MERTNYDRNDLTGAFICGTILGIILSILFLIINH